MKKKHHEIPLQIVIIPGLLLLISLLLLAFQQKDWAFMIMGIAIVVAILIHKED